MHVLFLALGGNRARAATEESAQVVADLGAATVLIDSARTWQRTPFDPRVRVVELSRLEAAHWPIKVERLLLYRAPGAALRAAGRGRPAGWADRAAGRYERRFADRVHRRLVAPAYRRIWGEMPHRLIRRHLLTGTPIDLLVVLDPLSMPYAQRLLEHASARGVAPRLAFGLDYADGAARTVGAA